METVYIIFAINPIILLAMTKETILAAVQALPEPIDFNELLERLIFIEKVEEGLRQSEAGETISQEEVERRVQSWRK